MAIKEQRSTLMQMLEDQLKLLNRKEIEGLEDVIKKYLEKLAITKLKKAEELKNTFPVEKTILFTYKNAEGQISERKMDVKQIIYSEQGWKLKGVCHTSQSMKTFNVERIIGETITDVQSNLQDTFEKIFNLANLER